MVRQVFRKTRFKASGFAVCAIGLMTVLGAASAVADPALQAADRCITQTNAPGTYAIISDQGVPQVVAGQGGTAAGASATNDCLLDAYGVQFGASPSGVVAAATGTTSQATLDECRRIRNRRIGGNVAAAVGFTIGFGDPYTAAALGGAVGVGISARRENRRYAECIASAYQPPVDPDAPVFVGCSRRERGVLSGGSSLCVAR
ncbi:hypothetical protein [uncultured Tateyamaria sp.]|uniref:hypothetical protein n=1 Tax=uncultured Tateyamaria sp. TaxID=455651 RepID=UPI00260339CC|nr:hypothetical protein [uncultured Tateyamaria sp.]